ncbi:hypothetical protein ES704_02736 [subsurface metagenome]|jgi:hypothetical protein
MARLCRITAQLKQHAIESLILAIELFNRPHNVLRIEGVLFFLQHAFEMLLKAAIYQNRRTIHEVRSNITYRFDKCLAIARSDLHILLDDEVLNLTILDGYRDCAMHHLLNMSEECLYIHAQSAVSIFDEILNRSFNDKLSNFLPSRVLPISTSPPSEMNLFMDAEFKHIHTLIAPNRRQRAEARARLRPYLIMESALKGKVDQPTNSLVNRTINRMKRGDDWRKIFPEVTTLKLDSSGHGLTYSVRFTKKSDAPPVRIVSEEENIEDATLVRELNMLDRYPMGISDLANKTGIGRNKLIALIEHIGLKSDPKYYKEFRRKSLRLPAYSIKALDKIHEVVPTVNLEEIWKEYCISKKLYGYRRYQ